MLISKSMEQTAEIERWDEWFGLVGLGEEWSKIKQACADTGQGPTEIIGWARIVELTRLGGIIESKVKV